MLAVVNECVKLLTVAIRECRNDSHATSHCDKGTRTRIDVAS